MLAWMAAEHLQQYERARRKGFRTVAVELRDHEPPEAITGLLDVYRAEERRLAELCAELRLVGRAPATQ